MLEGAKSMGAGAATIASAGAAVGIGNVFSSLIHSVFRSKVEVSFIQPTIFLKQIVHSAHSIEKVKSNP